MSPFISAASRNDTNAVLAMLDAGENVNQSVAGVTALAKAASVGHVEMVKLLLEKGANPNAAGLSGMTALDWAQRTNQSAVIEVLKEAGARHGAAARPTTAPAAGLAGSLLGGTGGGPKAASAALVSPGSALMAAPRGKAAMVKGEAQRRPVPSGSAMEPPTAERGDSRPGVDEAEAAGDEAAKAGDRRTAFEQYLKALRDAQPESTQSQRLREKLVGVAAALRPPLQLPEEARRRALRGRARLQAALTEGYEPALEEFSQALRAAPWWTEGYYNLGLVQEKAGRYAQAIASFKVYLTGAPGSPLAQKVQDSIYRLELAAEDAGKLSALEGRWSSELGTPYRVSIQGDKFEAVTDDPDVEAVKFRQRDGNCLLYAESGRRRIACDFGRSFSGTISGSSIEGLLRMPHTVSSIYGGTGGWACQIPGDTVPFTGKVETNGSLTFNYNFPAYQWQSQKTGFLEEQCLWVRLSETRPVTLKMTRMMEGADETWSGEAGEKRP